MTLRRITEAMADRNRETVCAAAMTMISGLWVEDEWLHKAARQLARSGRDKADRALLLEACGLRLYEAKPPTDASRSCRRRAIGGVQR